jgi:hypothetical protein
MAVKKVAVEGDVQKTPGTDITYGGKAETGTWSAGEVSYSSYEKLVVGGSKVIYQAKCTFSFDGHKTVTNPLDTPVKGSEEVTLEAQTTKLQGSLSKVLVHGDSQTDAYGNKLEAKASQKLSSA